ncbi:uncharacterized protein LOC143769782 [Ranitomeya variabilis]|uniref:uncharacterized protein LOC143769782 n=1 Tax=Ranitomeya variabilis TaxID=490064 RepID=UPI004055A86C
MRKITRAIHEKIYAAFSNMRSTELIHSVDPLKIIMQDLSEDIIENFKITKRNLHLIEKKIVEENITLGKIHLTLDKEGKKKKKLMKERIMAMKEIQQILQQRLEKETEELKAMEKTLRFQNITTRLFSAFMETIDKETSV